MMWEIDQQEEELFNQSEGMFNLHIAENEMEEDFFHFFQIFFQIIHLCRWILKNLNSNTPDCATCHNGNFS